MKNKTLTKTVKPRMVFSRKPMILAPMNDSPALPCRNLRDEFDFIIKKLYKSDATDELLRQLWQNAGNWILKNPSAKIEYIAHLVMAEYTGIQTQGTA